MRDGRNVIRRRRAILATLVMTSVLLLTAYFGEGPSGGILHGLQGGIQTVFGPIEEGASRVFKPVRDLTSWVGDTITATGQNDQLRSEVAVLRQRLAAAEIAARDGGQLQGIADLEREQGYPVDSGPVTARVILQSPTTWFSSIQIDKGRSAGVRVDQPAVTADGLAGKVTATTDGTATVTLITDASSAVSAQIMPKGLRGVVKPQVGDENDLLVDFLEKDERIDTGDTVVTSGSNSSRFESLFPRGIPIGEVSAVDPDEQALYQRVHIRPYANLHSIDFVEVLTAPPAAVPRTEAGL